MMFAQERIDKALDVAIRYSQIDGAHHKAWVIDQMVRALLEDEYEKWVRKYEVAADEVRNILNVVAADAPDLYKWDTGIAP